MPTIGKPAGENLHLILLALELVSRNEPDLPETLRAYVARVLREAAALASHPGSLGPGTSPEAISLALEFLGRDDLLGSIDHHADVPAITPELAAEFLKRMGKADASPG